jgi:hypothetical protein
MTYGHESGGWMNADQRGGHTPGPFKKPAPATDPNLAAAEQAVRDQVGKVPGGEVASIKIGLDPEAQMVALQFGGYVVFLPPLIAAKIAEQLFSVARHLSTEPLGFNLALEFQFPPKSEE